MVLNREPDAIIPLELHPYRALLTLPNVNLIKGEQCCVGRIYRTATGWCTNAPWLEFLQQDGTDPSAHHEHTVLQSKTLGPDGQLCWMTELAGEHHSDM